MNNNEYLNEEKYQQAKKKITRISLIILIVGLVIGGALIITGIVKQVNVKNSNEQAYNEAYKSSEQKVTEAEARIKEIDTEIEQLNAELDKLNEEKNNLSMDDPNWFNEISRISSESYDLNVKINKLEAEKVKLKNTNYTVFYNKIPNLSFLIFYFLGAGVIGTSCLIAGIFYLIAKRREIRAFTIQQTMPVTQEVIGKMAPTIGSAAGSIGKEIAKGITSGIKEGKKEE